MTTEPCQPTLLTLAKYVLATLVVGAAAVVIGLWLMLQGRGTDVAFQSSDGRWADMEVQFKGRSFEKVILPGFISYRACASEPVSLQRVTKRPPFFSTETLFNDYGDSKWAVPEAAAIGVAARGEFTGFAPCRGSLSHEQVLAEVAVYAAELSHNK